MLRPRVRGPYFPFLALITILAAALDVRADPFLTNGNLSVTVSSGNGTTDVVFNGVDFYQPGTPVSNFGFQLGTNTGTFAVNDRFGTNGANVTSVSLVGSSIVVTGTYAGMNITRTYSLVPGQNAFVTATAITNSTGATVNVRTFDTNDPDQGDAAPGGFGSGSQNDVFTLNGFQVGQDTSGFTAVVGSTNPGSVVGFGPGLGISNGFGLNSLFSSPFDPNGALADIGLGIGTAFSLQPGETGTFTVIQGFGTTPANAQAAFLAGANLTVPEPASLLVFGGALLAGVGYALRRRHLVTII